MHFGTVFRYFLVRLYETRTTKLSINKHITKSFEIWRGVQSNPNNSFLFVTKMSFKCKKMEGASKRFDVQTKHVRTLQTSPFFADNFVLNAKSPIDAIHLKNAQWSIV